ncbi:MAG: prepilin-type N-terminal cleavage/methylation domain-containing protein [Candidatus Jettenia sp.]|nr:MAG: prepilin-type N-terminal cleavage/methylation domain-containing protein [Candidatus Jettenia sp.]
MITKNYGFTIIELLIAVTVITILMSIVLPMISIIRHKAQQVVCSNNLRELFLAFEQYANDNNGLLPRSNNDNQSRDNSKTCSAEVWFKAVDHYLTSSIIPNERDKISYEERLLLIKQDPIFKTVPLSKQDTTRTIKMNRYLVPKSECQRSIESIQNPTRTVLLFDGRIDSSGVADDFEGSHNIVAQRHSKAANILFVDGHVECIQNGDSDGTTNEGWPNSHAGRELVWDPDVDP